MDVSLAIVKFLIRSGIAERLPMVRRKLSQPRFLRYYSDRILAAPTRQLRQLDGLLAGPAPQIDMSLGAPTDAELLPDCPVSTCEPSSGYPPPAGLSRLRHAIAADIERTRGVEFSPANEISVVNGASQALHIVLETFANAGDKVVLFDPTFLVYAMLTRYHRARLAWVPSSVVDGETRFEMRALEKAMHGAKLIFVNSPANPTGGVLSHESLAATLDLARRHDVLIVSDEVYDQFVYDRRHVSVVEMPGAFERTILLNSFSKSHAMAGARVGYIAANEHLMRPMRLSQFLTTPFVSFASQQQALAALDSSHSHWPAIRAEYRGRQQTSVDVIRSAGLPCATPGGAFYVWFSVSSLGVSAEEFVRRLLDDYGVLLLPGTAFGPSGERCVRLSYAVDRETLGEGLRRVSACIANLDRCKLVAPRRSRFWWGTQAARIDTVHSPTAPHVGSKVRTATETDRM